MEHIITIKDLIGQLNSFEDKNLEVVLSIDDCESYKPLNIVGKIDGKCALIYSETFNS